MIARKTMVLCGLIGLGATMPMAARAQTPNAYKPMVTAPPAPQDPAHPNLVNPGAPAITPPGSINGVIVPSMNSKMPVIKPLAPSNMPVFPPPGSPGGNPNVVPK
jgi:hypothetical protein